MCIFQCTLDGEGELMTGGRTWRLKTGDTMLLSVPEDHRYRLPQDSPRWKHVYVNLSGSESVRIWTELKRKFGPVVHLPIDRSKSLDSAFSIVSAAKNKRIRSALHASSLAYGFLMTLFEELTVLDITASEASFVLDAVRFCMEHYAEDITVAECPLRSMRCLSLQNGRIVGINTARFDSSAEVRTALIHEDGHFASGAFYLPYSPYQLKAQAEYRADKAAVLKHIPYPELAARLRRGDTLADAAEYFCVTEDFLRKAYALYRDMGYSFGAEEKA